MAGARHPSRGPEGPPPPPVVQKLRFQYTKRGRLRFTSTRDFQRALERAVRRANIPMAYSAGFHPHPKISYANAAPTGAASEAEYFELGLAIECQPEDVRQRLDEALPDGLDVVTVVPATPGALADRLEASHWQILAPSMDLGKAQAAAEQFWATETLLQQRVTKSGAKDVDVRAPILSITARAVESATGAPATVFDIFIRHVTPSVRPGDLVQAFTEHFDLPFMVPPVHTRLAQGPWDAEKRCITDPLGGAVVHAAS